MSLLSRLQVKFWRAYLRWGCSLDRKWRARLPAVRRLDPFVDAWLASVPSERIALVQANFGQPRTSRTLLAFWLAGGVVAGFRLVRPNGLTPEEVQRWTPPPTTPLPRVTRFALRNTATGVILRRFRSREAAERFLTTRKDPEGSASLNEDAPTFPADLPLAHIELIEQSAEPNPVVDPVVPPPTIESVAGQVIAIASLAGCLWPGMDVEYRDVPAPIN